jgi:beta-lactam-binding protein with PASTA domain
MNKNEDKKEKKSRKGLKLLLVNLVAMVTVVVAAVIITFRWIDNYTEHGVALMVPDITGLQEEEAMDKLAQHHLVGVTDGHVYVKGVPPGEITAQRPAANAKVKRGRKIYLTANSGNQPMITLPDIIENSSLREAESRLRAAGFQLTPHDTIPGDMDWVYGVRDNGRELQDHERIPEGAELTIIVGGGDKGKEQEETPHVEEGWFD